MAECVPYVDSSRARTLRVEVQQAVCEGGLQDYREATGQMLRYMIWNDNYPNRTDADPWIKQRVEQLTDK
jgi:hypothetical protein